MEDTEFHCGLTQSPSFALDQFDLTSPAISDSVLRTLDLCEEVHLIDPVSDSTAPPSVSSYLPSENGDRTIGLKRGVEFRTQNISSLMKRRAVDCAQVNALLAKVSRPSAAAAFDASVSGNVEDIDATNADGSSLPKSTSDETSVITEIKQHDVPPSRVKRSLGTSRCKPYKSYMPAKDSTASSSIVSRIPLMDNINSRVKQNSPRSRQTNPPEISIPSKAFYSVMYCVKKRYAKRKGPWFDGVLVARGSKCTLQDTEGKIICKDSHFGKATLAPDSVIEISKYEVEIMRVASPEEYESGTLFTGSFGTDLKTLLERKENGSVFHCNSGNGEGKKMDLHSSRTFKPKVKALQNFQPSITKEALILNANHLASGSTPVMVDPYLATKLRPHQREGVQFMYECIMGLRSPAFTGCLLADEMGLGKTVQVLALIWTLLQQSSGHKSRASFKHIVVVCPSSLVENWGNEVRKWLGIERLKALLVHACSPKEAEQRFLDFKNSKMHPLLITSYELLRRHQELIASAKPGLLVCDEAHRLKNSAGNKTINALLALNCPRRVLLTGTPVQNDLNEFYAMVDFANPNLLGPLPAFKRLYSEPIELSRDRDASDEQKQIGQARFLELQGRTKFCILRRTAVVNSGYLPPKKEYLVFCRLQPLQISLYEAFLRSQFVTRLFLSDTSTANVLTAISVLRKLCNHPRLVSDDVPKRDLENSLKQCGYGEGLELIKAHDGSANQLSTYTQYAKYLSGKLDCLCALLSTIFERSSDQTEKVVVVSNFTKTLNLVQGLCDHKGWKWLRLDGGTLVGERQRLVDRFNSAFGGERVFLLSSKAGGMGLNLIGANRLILFDPDWNPATDAQAMARIWRDGQRKAVIIYRLFSTGSIEEKIYQRQLVKGEIAATVEDSVDSKNKNNCGRYFSRDELRELFTLNSETHCDTFDLLSRRELSVDEQWQDCSVDVDDLALKEAVGCGVVSFVQRKLHTLEVQEKM
ncbi:hypothetical protein KP509_12G046200 [Ceratopteris richardii]|uniref:Uncharacterized protein n=2 Tax=Ceratopteris richardii TaxID=49495 RepID=A0A8T2TPA0_CERRI|nr:hypothetical protein KP509_12G046200 [Ceratopteris richardii]